MRAIITELKEQLGSPLGQVVLDELHCDSYLLSKFGRQDVWGEEDLVYYQIIGQIEKELNTRFNHYGYENNPYSIQVIRHIKSAREAIAWVNWGTDPEEFSAQT